jgi:hypothetical protein
MVRDLSEEWERLRPVFDWDGALRDIYVFDTDEHDWDRVLTYLRTERKLEFTIDGVPAQLPSHASELFELRGKAMPLLVVDPSGLHANTHFFMPSEIEFDLNPRRLTSPQDLGRLFEFMRGMSSE